MIQQMGLWFAKTKGVKRDKQTVTTDKQQGVRRVTVHEHACLCFCYSRSILIREKSRVTSVL